jgi:preprotein translocase subunit SecF
MEWIRPDININFVGMRFKAFLFSIAIIVLSIVVLLLGGLKLGVDFAGGTLVQIQFNRSTTPDEVRAGLAKVGLGEGAIQQIGVAEDNEFLIRTDVSTEEMRDLSTKIGESLAEVYGAGVVTVRRVEMVGPKVGQDLRQKAMFAIFYAMLFIAIYISGRFELKWGTSGVMVAGLLAGVFLLQALGIPFLYLTVGALLLTLVLCWVLKLPYAMAAVIALLHDVLITLGIFALTDREFSLEVLAALLTIAGYSLNDTIVVFDRIRENVRKERRMEFSKIINMSINQTLSRTILTGLTTLLALIFLFIFGGTVIQDFAFAMIIGIIAGTYSSVFVASPLLILYEDWTRTKRQPVRSKRATA